MSEFKDSSQANKKALCGAYYEDLIDKEFNGKSLKAWDVCPDDDCKQKISAHTKRPNQNSISQGNEFYFHHFSIGQQLIAIN